MKKLLTIASILVLVFALSVPSMAADNVSDNVTVNVEVLPTITLTVSTNSISFANANPAVAAYEKTGAMQLTVQSNNTYKIGVVASDDLKTGDATPLVMPINSLQAKVQGAAGTNYQSLSKTEQVVLVNNQPNTASTVYDVDLKLNSDWSFKPGNYSTTLIFVAAQI